MAEAWWNDTLIARSDDIVTVEGNAYFPLEAVTPGVLGDSATTSFCPWKGTASYLHLAVPGTPTVPNAAWTYPAPTSQYDAIAGHLAFYPQRVDACFIDDERVEGNDGSFYGGWITADLRGPFKGAPGTLGW